MLALCSLFGPSPFTFAFECLSCVSPKTILARWAFGVIPATPRKLGISGILSFSQYTCVRTVKAVRSTSDPCVRLLSEGPNGTSVGFGQTPFTWLEVPFYLSKARALESTQTRETGFLNPGLSETPLGASLFPGSCDQLSGVRV